jgi:ubiquinone/menaquinone biosynthesis C-methylase UbiE
LLKDYLALADSEMNDYIPPPAARVFSMPSPPLYTDLSHYYDVLCSNIDYGEQCDFGMRANRIWGNGGDKYLDLACGSGSLLAHFAQADFTCSGLDISAKMLKIAQQRCPSAMLICADMKELSAPTPQDLISCFLYSTHYCTSIPAIQQTFVKVFECLAPGGLFCFDAVDKDSIANDEGHVHLLRHNDCDLRFQTRWHYCGHGDAMDLHINIQEIRQQQQFHYQDRHGMTAVKIHTLRQMLENAGFSVMILEHDFGCLGEWQGVKGNVIFCASKSSRETVPIAHR